MPIVNATPFMNYMLSPRVVPEGRVSVTEVLTAARFAIDNTVIVDVRHLEKDPSPTIVFWLKGIARTQGIDLHLQGRDGSRTFGPEARLLPHCEIPQSIVRALLEDILNIQRADATGRRVVEIYGEVAAEPLYFLSTRFESQPPLAPDEEIAGDLARPFFESIFKWLQHDGSGEKIASAYGERAVEPLIFLMDRFPEVLAPALRALGRIGGRRLAAVIGAYLSHEDPSVRNAAVRALRTTRTAEFFEDLWRIALDGGEHSQVRREAAISLGLFGDLERLPRLVALLRSEDVLERLTAARALGWYAIPVLRSSGVKRGRWTAIRASVVSALEERIEDSSNLVSTQARWSLRKLSEIDSCP